MASPLIFRIVTQADTSGIEETQGKLRDLRQEFIRTGQVIPQSTQEIDNLTRELGGLPKEPLAPAARSIRGFGAELMALRSSFRLLRFGLFFGTFAVAPILRVTRSIQELDSQINPLITRLNQLGGAGELQGRRLLEFSRSFQRSQGVSAVETLKALNALVTATKSTADAESTIATARTVSLATGIDLVKVTEAIASAMNGNSESLARLTGLTVDYIDSARHAGTLTSDLGRRFAGDAARGAASLSEIFRRLVSGARLAAVELAKVAPGAGFVKLSESAKKAATDALSLQRALALVQKSRIVEPLPVRNLDEINFAIGEIEGRIASTELAIKSSTQATEEQSQSLKEQLANRTRIRDILVELQNAELKLTTQERKRIELQSQSLDVARTELELRRATGRNEFLLDPDVERQRQRLAKSREEEAVFQARAERDAVTASKGRISGEESALIQQRLSNRLLELRSDEEKRRLSRQKEIATLSEDELRRVREEEQAAKKAALREPSRPRVTQAEVEFLREQRKLDERGGRDLGITEDQRQAVERIRELNERIAKEKVTINVEPAFTPGAFGRLAREAGKEFISSLREFLNRQGVNNNNADNLSTAPVAPVEG